MIAIIKTGGKQYVVKPGDKLRVEKLEQKEGETVVFSEVLLVEKDANVKIGSPIIEKAVVEAKVLKQDKADKLYIFKYKAKKRYSRKIGHRQPFTEIEITEIKS